MGNIYSKKDGNKEPGSISPMPQVKTEEPRQTRDYCTGTQAKLQGYFEKGVRETKHMDPGTRNHLGYCSECSDFFDMLINPDCKK